MPLWSTLKGHKSAVRKFKTIQQEAIDYNELQTIQDSLRQKLQLITDIQEKILDSVPDDNGDQIETEILDHDECIYNLQTKDTESMCI